MGWISINTPFGTLSQWVPDPPKVQTSMGVPIPNPANFGPGPGDPSRQSVPDKSNNNNPDRSPPPAPAPDPRIAELERQMRDLQAKLDAEARARRNNVFDSVTTVLKSYGIDLDGTGLSALVRQWAQDDKSADWIRINLRDQQAYKDRFPAMAELIKRGQFMDEAAYIEQERQYRQVLTSFDLPTGFYDQADDYTKFILNQVSVKELSDRITGAKTFLDENTDSAYKQALQSFYGVSEGGMLAYVLDGDRAQPLIEKQIKAAAFAGAADTAGFGELTATQAERYGATLGDQYDAFGADARMQLEGRLGQIGAQAANDERLAFIDRQQFDRTDLIDAYVMNDQEKRLASESRGKREQARFGGSTAFRQGSLSNNRNV